MSGVLMARRGRKRRLDAESLYWQLILSGVGTDRACQEVGIGRKTGYRWRAENGGLLPGRLAEHVRPVLDSPRSLLAAFPLPLRPQRRDRSAGELMADHRPFTVIAGLASPSAVVRTASPPGAVAARCDTYHLKTVRQREEISDEELIARESGMPGAAHPMDTNRRLKAPAAGVEQQHKQPAGGIVQAPQPVVLVDHPRRGDRGQ
jgi:hypothetical protein